MTTFNLEDKIFKVRALEAKMKELQAELDTKLEPMKKYATAWRTEILAHLNATRQKSTQTDTGGAYWKNHVTYRIEDKDAFRRHVIGTDQWELLTWAAMPSICETFTEEHDGEPPPGLVRNSVQLLYITPPTKANAAAAEKKTNGVAKAAE